MPIPYPVPLTATVRKAVAPRLRWLLLLCLVCAGCTPIQPRPHRQPPVTQSSSVPAQTVTPTKTVAPVAECALLTADIADLISGEPITDVIDHAGHLCGYGGVAQAIGEEGNLLDLGTTYGVAIGVYPQPLVGQMLLRVADAMVATNPEADQIVYAQIAQLADAGMTLGAIGEISVQLHKLVGHKSRWSAEPLALLGVPGTLFQVTHETGQHTMLLLATSLQSENTLVMIAHRRNAQDAFDSASPMVAIAYAFASGQADVLQSLASYGAKPHADAPESCPYLSREEAQAILGEAVQNQAVIKPSEQFCSYFGAAAQETAQALPAVASGLLTGRVAFETVRGVADNFRGKNIAGTDKLYFDMTLLLDYGNLGAAIAKLPEYTKLTSHWQAEIHGEIGQGAVVLWHGEPAQEVLLIARDQAERLIYLSASPAPKQPIAESKDLLLVAAKAMLDRTQADLAALLPPSTPTCDFPSYVHAKWTVAMPVAETLATGSSFCGYGDLVSIVDGAGTLGDLNDLYGIAVGVLPDDKAGEFILWLAEGLRQDNPNAQDPIYTERTQELQALVSAGDLGKAMSKLYGFGNKPGWDVIPPPGTGAYPVWELGPVYGVGAEGLGLSKKLAAKDHLAIVIVPRPVRGMIVVVSHEQTQYDYERMNIMGGVEGLAGMVNGFRD